METKTSIRSFVSLYQGQGLYVIKNTNNIPKSCTKNFNKESSFLILMTESFFEFDNSLKATLIFFQMNQI